MKDKFFRSLIFAVVFLCVVSAPIERAGAQNPPGQAPAAKYRSGEVLVKFFKKTPTIVELASFEDNFGVRVIGNIEALGINLLAVPEGSELESAQTISQSPLVAFAEPNYIGRIAQGPHGLQTFPNDPRIDQQWGYFRLGAHTARERLLLYGVSRTVPICITDTGTDPDHPDLAGTIIAGRNFAGGDPDNIDDWNPHGTLVHGIIAAWTNNGVGIASVGATDSARGARVLIAKVIHHDGTGSVAELASGIAWCFQSGARVINISLAYEEQSATLKSAVDFATERGLLVVAAAGNGGSVKYPAKWSNILAVGCVDNRDRVCASSRGPEVDVSAPGANIVSTYPGGHYSLGNPGTSYSASHVSGIAALILAARPDLNANTEVFNQIVASAENMTGGHDPGYGWGIASADQALAKYLPFPEQPTETPAPPAPTSTPTETPPPIVTIVPAPTPTATHVPQLVVEPNNVAILLEQGSPEEMSKVVTVNGIRLDGMPWRAEVDQSSSWLQVEPFSGVIPAKFIVTVNPSMLIAGVGLSREEHNTAVTVWCDQAFNSPVAVTVRIVVVEEIKRVYLPFLSRHHDH